jgi:transcription initiation factor TFIIB
MNKLSNTQIEDLLGIRVPSDIHKKICSLCGSDDFIEDYTKGIVYCKCGNTVETTIFDNGVGGRSGDGDENDMFRGGLIHNKLLPQSSLGTRCNARGRIKKLHIWAAMPYKERSDNIMFKKIHVVCQKYKIYRKIEDDAKIMCKRMSGTKHKSGKNTGKPIITRGFNRSGIIAACLFIACRRNDETRSVKEIAYYFGIAEKDVNKGIRSLLAILDDDDIVNDIGTSKVVHFIRRKCDELLIQNKHADTAYIIANNIDKLNIGSNHTTYSLAAASILLTTDIYHIDCITKKRLSTTFCGLSDVTIGKTYNQIKDLGEILTDNALVSEISQEILRQKNKRIITQIVYDKMIQMGVDTSKYVLKGHENNSHVQILKLNTPTRFDIITRANIIDKRKKIIDEISEDSHDSHDSHESTDYNTCTFMITEIRKTLKELKYMNTLCPDSIDIIKNISTKMKMMRAYIADWAIEIGIYPSIS